MASFYDIVTMNGAFGQLYLDKILSATLKQFPLIEGSAALPSVPIPFTIFTYPYVTYSQANPLAAVNDGSGIPRFATDVTVMSCNLTHYDAGWTVTNHERYGYSFGEAKLIQNRLQEASRAMLNCLSVAIVEGFEDFINSGDPQIISDTASVGTGDSTVIPYYFAGGDDNVCGIAWGNKGAIVYGAQVESLIPAEGSKSNFAMTQAIDAYAAPFFAHSFALGKLALTVGSELPANGKENQIDDLFRDVLAKFPLSYRPRAIYTSRLGKAAVAKYRAAYNPFGIPADYDTSIDGIPIVAVDQLETGLANAAKPKATKVK